MKYIYIFFFQQNKFNYETQQQPGSCTIQNSNLNSGSKQDALLQVKFKCQEVKLH